MPVQLARFETLLRDGQRYCRLLYLFLLSENSLTASEIKDITTEKAPLPGKTQRFY